MAISVSDGARLLAAGEVVAFPTETVYGLGADATRAAAIAKVFALKGRPANHPVIVHIASAQSLSRWAGEIPSMATTLVERFWPGPLTLILRRSREVPDAVTGGQDTVGLRCPSHPVAQELLREFARLGGGALAAPSANRFGHVSPTTASHVRDEFGGGVPVIDGGECEIGLESTIVDLSRGHAVLLRPGAITREEIAAAIGQPVTDRDADSPRASGTLDAHYAPRATVVLVDAAQLREVPANSAVLRLDRDPARYAHHLYASLRRLDAEGVERIFVERPPATPEWEAVNDRLARAASTG